MLQNLKDKYNFGIVDVTCVTLCVSTVPKNEGRPTGERTAGQTFKFPGIGFKHWGIGFVDALKTGILVGVAWGSQIAIPDCYAFLMDSRCFKLQPQEDVAKV